MDAGDHSQVLGRAQEILNRRGLKKCVEFLVDKIHTTTDTLAMVQAETWLLAQASPKSERDLATLDLLAGNLFTAQDNACRRIGEAMRNPFDDTPQMDWLELHAKQYPEAFHACILNFLGAMTWDKCQWGQRMNTLVREHWAGAARQAAYGPVSTRSTPQDEEGKLVCLVLAWIKAGEPEHLTTEDWAAVEHLGSRVLPLSVLARFSPIVDEWLARGRLRALENIVIQQEGRALPSVRKM